MRFGALRNDSSSRAVLCCPRIPITGAGGAHGCHPVPAPAALAVAQLLPATSLCSTVSSSGHSHRFLPCSHMEMEIRVGESAPCDPTPRSSHGTKPAGSSSLRHTAQRRGAADAARPWDYCFPDSSHQHCLWICFKMLSGHLLGEVLALCFAVC